MALPRTLTWLVLYTYAMAAVAMSSCPNNFQRNPEKGPLGQECELTSSAAPTGDATLCYAKMDLHSYRQTETLPEEIIQTIRAKFEALRRVGTQALVRCVTEYILQRSSAILEHEIV